MLSDLRLRWRRLTTFERRESPPAGSHRGLAALIARAPPVATLILGLAVAAQIADITLSLLSDSAVDAPVRSITVRGRMASRGGAIPLAALSISRAHLFGTAPVE